MEKMLPIIGIIVGFWFVFGLIISQLGNKKPSTKQALKTGGQSVVWLFLAVAALAIAGAFWGLLSGKL